MNTIEFNAVRMDLLGIISIWLLKILLSLICYGLLQKFDNLYKLL
jgi:hypothetical protein